MKLASQIALVLTMLAAVAGGAFLLVRQSSSGGSFEILLPTPSPTSEAELSVYITGAVRNPGVYSVKAGARLAQAIEAAGGTTDDADLAAVNLAVRVRDEDHWHIPRIGEPAPSPSLKGGTATGAASGSGKIDVNSATANELVALPGIGEVIAQRIVDYRQAHGPFSSVEGLLDVRGIGPAILEAIRGLVEVR